VVCDANSFDERSLLSTPKPPHFVAPARWEGLFSAAKTVAPRNHVRRCAETSPRPTPKLKRATDGLSFLRFAHLVGLMLMSVGCPVNANCETAVQLSASPPGDLVRSCSARFPAPSARQCHPAPRRHGLRWRHSPIAPSGSLPSGPVRLRQHRPTCPGPCGNIRTRNRVKRFLKMSAFRTG
jgi:hypothetical protein